MPFQLRALPGLLLAGLLAACDSGVQGFAFISDVNGAYLPAGPVGSTYIVEGIQFGDTQGDANVYFTNTLGGTALVAPVSSWANNFVVGTVPAGAVSGPLVLDNGNGPNNGLTFFAVLPAPTFTPASVSWTAGSSLPVGLSGHAVASGNLMHGTHAVYVLGGADSTDTPGNSVLFATAPASGALGAWQATTSLSLPVAFHAAVVAVPSNSAVNSEGYLIAIGGATDKAGTSTNQIWRAPLNQDGTVGTWTRGAGDTLPVPLHSFGAVIFFGHLYIIGGQKSDNTPVNTVYRAVIKPDGSLLPNPWTVESPLPYPRSHFGYGQFNGVLYVVGGDSGKVTPNDSLVTSSAVGDIHLAMVDLYSRDLKTGWVQSANNLSIARSSATAVVSGAPAAPALLVSGGLFSTAPTGEETYAPVAAVGGAVGSLSAAANTINAQCGCKIFNQAATGYTTTDGTFHVIVVGGDDAAAPGKKRKQVYTY